MGIEPTSSAWKADILADVLYPQLQKELYHNFVQMSSMNLGGAKLGRHNKKHCTLLCSVFLSGGDYRAVVITVTLLQSMHGALPNHLETYPQKSVCEWVRFDANTPNSVENDFLSNNQHSCMRTI